MVLFVDPNPLLGLHRLVQTIGPAATLEGSPGELVDDADLALGHEVVLVAVVELLGAQGLGQLVDVVDADGVVEVVDVECTLDLLDAGLGRHDRLLLLIDLVVDVTRDRVHDRGEAVVELGRLVGWSGDDERRACLVDEDRVDLVDDGVDVVTLRHGLAGSRHVVAQVVEPELCIRPVGDVTGVGGPLELRIRDVRAHPAHRESHPTVELAHPLRVTRGEVVV